MPNLFQIEIESFKPSVDMYETKSGMHIDIELPGISQEHVEVSTDNQNLVVKGNKKQTKLGDRYHRLERSFGFFYRNIKLS